MYLWGMMSRAQFLWLRCYSFECLEAAGDDCQLIPHQFTCDDVLDGSILPFIHMSVVFSLPPSELSKQFLLLSFSFVWWRLKRGRDGSRVFSLGGVAASYFDLHFDSEPCAVRRFHEQNDECEWWRHHTDECCCSVMKHKNLTLVSSSCCSSCSIFSSNICSWRLLCSFSSSASWSETKHSVHFILLSAARCI